MGMSKEQHRQLQAFLGRHDLVAYEGEARTYAVVCSCGFKAAANYGIEQAAGLMAAHFRTYGLEVDPSSMVVR